jgi:hypothetical protein
LESIKFKPDSFKQKILDVECGKEKEALKFASDSIKFVKSNFSSARGTRRQELVQIYHGAYSIFNHVGKKHNCFKCKNKNLLSAFSSYSVLHNCKSENVKLRIMCGAFLKETFQEIKSLYTLEKKFYELSVIKKKYNKNYNPLILVKHA